MGLHPKQRRTPSPGRFRARRRGTGLKETLVGLGRELLETSSSALMPSTTVDAAAGGDSASPKRRRRSRVCSDDASAAGGEEEEEIAEMSLEQLFVKMNKALRTLSLLFVALAAGSLFALATDRESWALVLNAASLGQYTVAAKACVPFIPSFANLFNSSAYAVFLFRASKDFKRAASEARRAERIAEGLDSEDEEEDDGEWEEGGSGVGLRAPRVEGQSMFDGIVQIIALFRKMAIPTTILACRFFIVGLYHLWTNYNGGGAEEARVGVVGATASSEL